MSRVLKKIIAEYREHQVHQETMERANNKVVWVSLDKNKENIKTMVLANNE